MYRDDYILRMIQRRGSAEKAARSSIFLACAPEAASITGTYVEPNARPGSPAPAALDWANQEKTWELAASLVRNAPTAILVGPVDTAMQLITTKLK